MTNQNSLSLEEIRDNIGSSAYRNSFVSQDGVVCCMENRGGGKLFCLVSRSGHHLLEDFQGEEEPFKAEYVLKRCPPSHKNGSILRKTFRWLKPVLLGLKSSAGLGDRLGLATPGHARALSSLRSDRIAPVFAQQSIREMERSGRQPADVINDATWGAFQAGWRCAAGADADHLKTSEDIDRCAEAGFTLFTIDPGAYVDNDADTDTAKKLAALPWETLESDLADTERRYAGKKIDFEPNAPFENRILVLEKNEIMCAAAKYGRAVAHVVEMARHLETTGVLHELEVSVDETESPTLFSEHVYIASELKRLGVKWVSLAPRYVGRFEKGVDYIGNPESISRHLAGHAAIARALGPYKLSLHSGSDKFSIYPLMSKACGGLFHLKTAGTSYVEALRVIAEYDQDFFREIARFAVECYPQDKATYHVSADMNSIPDLGAVPSDQLSGLVDDMNVRQALHVTFGSVLKRWGAELKAALHAHEEAYYDVLEEHFLRHLSPFLDGQED